MKSDNVVLVIIVKFTRRCVRDALYKARSRLKNLTIEDIGLGSQGENKIFIQESLIPARRSYYTNVMIYVVLLCKDDASINFKMCSKKDLVKW